MKERKLFLKKSKKLTLATSLVGLIAGLLSFLATILPAYEVSGVINGVIALSWYYVIAFDNRIFLNVLDTISFLTIIVNIANFFVIVSSIVSITLTLREKGNSLVFELPFSSSLVYMMYLGLLLGIFRVMSREVLSLAGVYSEVTSAGLLFSGRAHIHETLFSKILFPIIPLPLIVGFTYLTLSSILMIQYLKFSS
ncbi:MAG: hypothetical protein DRN04_11600 [Thermoprotei archaeon]|nr:MAG: hypothetical protein DRN04_11600 [Thermoprotei archaeon]